MFVMVVMPTVGPVYMVEVVFFCCFFCFSHSLSMPILASWSLGASLAFSGYRGAPIAAWVSPWSKPHASTDIKNKKKNKKDRSGRRTFLFVLITCFCISTFICHFYTPTLIFFLYSFFHLSCYIILYNSIIMIAIFLFFF